MTGVPDIRVLPDNTGLLHFPENTASAQLVSSLLQRNLQEHHSIFNESGFHNHIPHHLLALYGTGSSAEDLKKAYDDNAIYQRSTPSVDQNIVDKLLNDWASAHHYMGKAEHYSSFLSYFERKIEACGWQEVVMSHVFAETATSNEVFVRLFSGLLHPSIQLMYGIEWNQPAIVAEGLAQACIHDNTLGDLLKRVEQLANSKNTQYTDTTLPEILEQIRSDESIRGWATNITQGRTIWKVLGDNLEKVLELASQINVRPENVEERAVELIHTMAWVATTASWHPPHVPRFDFHLIHHLNASPLILAICKQDWLPKETLARLVSWRMRYDVIDFITRGSPPLHIDVVDNYVPKDKYLVSNPRELLPRFHAIRDDGHTVKVARSFLIAQEASEKYPSAPWIRFRSNSTWLKAHYLLLDSTEAYETRWIFSAGFDEQWNDVPQLT